MPLVQDDHLVQALASDTPNQTLDIRMLPGTLWRGQHFLAAHVPHTLSKGWAVDGITVPEQIPGRFVPGKRLHYLLRRPLGGRMLGDVAVHHTSALMREDHEHEEHLERDGRHGEEIEGNQTLRMICEQGLPCE